MWRKLAVEKKRGNTKRLRHFFGLSEYYAAFIALTRHASNDSLSALRHLDNAYVYLDPSISEDQEIRREVQIILSLLHQEDAWTLVSIRRFLHRLFYAKLTQEKVTIDELAEVASRMMSPGGSCYDTEDEKLAHDFN